MDDIKPIQWSNLPMSCLSIPAAKNKSCTLERRVVAHIVPKIKNTIAIAKALAAAKSEDLDSSHISRALEAKGKVLPVSGDASDEGLYD